MVHWTDRDTGVLTSSPNVAVAWSRLPAFSWRTIIVRAHALHVRWRHPPTIRRWHPSLTGALHLNRVQRAFVATMKPQHSPRF